MSISIEKVSYRNMKDVRILETVLSNWFKNPKELNLIEPRMNYPFKFKKWVALTYKNSDIESFVLKENKWIVGIGNIIFNEDNKRAHALHIFIDEKYRRKGLATKMLQHLESLARDKRMSILTLRVMPKNTPAINLYEKMGFEEYMNTREHLSNSNNANNGATILQKLLG
tara:strand:- start:334 stop:843 length:510 start_codon:yes stop_codon:yes gene_type:complete